MTLPPSSLAVPAVAGACRRVAAVRAARRHRSERWAGGALAVLMWGLTFHIVFIAALFGLFRLPLGAVRAAAMWKELLSIALLAWVLIRSAMGQGTRVVPQATDLAVGALVALTAIHALAAFAGIGIEPTFDSTVLGTRDLVFFLSLYVVGRASPLAGTSPVVWRRLLAIGAITGAIALVEWWVVTPELLVVLGVARYFNDFLGVSVFTAANSYGLPGNYWTMIGSHPVQRAGSVYLSSQGFAITYLLIVPAATAWIGFRRRWTSPLALACYAVAWAGLLLSVTRMTTFVCVAQVVLILVLQRRPTPLVVLSVVGVVMATALFLAVPALPSFVWDTLAWQSGSSTSHSKDYVNGLAALWARPLGNGLGTADMTAARLGREMLTADNQFLKYGVELGLPGLLAFTWLLVALLWTGTRAALAARSTRLRTTGVVLAAMTLGVIMNGMTAVVANSPTLIYIYCWIAGASVTRLATAERGAAASAAPG